MSPAPGQDPLHPPGGGFSLVEFATRRRVTIAMMTLTLVLFGLITGIGAVRPPADPLTADIMRAAVAL